jgi:hypothetical protein
VETLYGAWWMVALPRIFEILDKGFVVFLKLGGDVFFSFYPFTDFMITNITNVLNQIVHMHKNLIKTRTTQ